MSVDKLLALGAECVGGDLLLNRQVVGIHRNGQFIITPEGADALAQVVDVEAVEVPEPTPTPTPAKRARAKAAVVEELPAPAQTPADPTAGLDAILN